MTQHIEEAWRYEIQYGPEGEADYAWLYRGNDMVATMKTHHAVAIAAALAAAEERGRMEERERCADEKHFESGTKCRHCNGKGHQAGDPEGAPIEDCDYCGGSGKGTFAGKMKLFGHWSKHRLADGVFLPLVCYVPEGPDYTTVPLYAITKDPTP